MHFLFIGDGPTLPTVIERINSAGANDFTTFTGLIPQDQAPFYLALSDIFVSPHVPNPDGSRFFGSPTKLFEYMAMERPIIASSLEQISDILQPSISIQSHHHHDPLFDTSECVAVSVVPDSSNEIVAAIQFLVERPELRKTLGKNARSLVLRKFTWDIHTQKILDRLSSLELID